MDYLIKHKTVLTWLTLLILTNCLSIYLFTTGILSFPNTAIITNDSPEFLSEITKLNQLSNIINRNYTGDIDNKAIGEKLAETLFAEIGDPYSEYFTADEYSTILNSYSGSFGGIGVEIDGSNPEVLKINRVIEGSPAQNAGVQAEDIIKKVNGEDITGQPLDVVVSKTRGEIGTDVTITVLRGDQEIDFTITRGVIDNQTVFSENIDGIGYIYITNFGNGTAEQFQKAVDELVSQNVTDLIIDLRENTGGVVTAAVEVADILLDQQVIGYSVDKQGNKENFTTQDGKVEIPFVVLVDENTASASELLAGALQKNGATIIGKPTFGKGVIQVMSELPDGSGYKLTFQEYFLNDGTKVNKTGITPNIVIEPSEEMISGTITDNSQDPQFQKALEEVRNN